MGALALVVSFSKRPGSDTARVCLSFLYFSTLLFSVLAFVPGGLAPCFGRDLYASGVYQFVSPVFGSRRRELYGGCNLRRNSQFLEAWLYNNTFSPISREIPVVPSLAFRMFMLTP